MIPITLMPGDDLYKTHYMDPLTKTGQEPSLFEDFKYLFVEEMSREQHFVATQNDNPIGILGIQPNPYNPQQLWLKFVSVHADHRNNGVATALIRALFEHAQANALAIKRSCPSDMGGRYLPSVFDKMTAAYPDVLVIAHDDHTQ